MVYIQGENIFTNDSCSIRFIAPGLLDEENSLVQTGRQIGGVIKALRKMDIDTFNPILELAKKSIKNNLIQLKRIFQI